MRLVALLTIYLGLLTVAAAVADARPVSARVDRAHDVVRVDHHLRALKADPYLTHLAQRRARWLVRRHRFTHGNFERRMRRAGLRRAAENLAWAGGTDPPVGATMRAWMASPAHRENILGRWKRIGVGVAKRTPSGDPGRTYVVLFARNSG